VAAAEGCSVLLLRELRRVVGTLEDPEAPRTCERVLGGESTAAREPSRELRAAAEEDDEEEDPPGSSLPSLSPE
jgi:hypothetical protein